MLSSEYNNVPTTRHFIYNLKDDQRPEPVPKDNHPEETYPRWIGHKFDPDGNALPFPGNTVICHLSPESQIFRALLTLYKELSKSDLSVYYHLLPPTSWHMTVFEGVCNPIRKPGFWPDDLSVNSDLMQCHALFQQKLEQFDPGSETSFKMRVDGWEPLEDGVSLRLVPVNSVEERRLRGLRDRLSNTLNIRHPGHESYVFHISIAYMLRRLRLEEYQKIDMLQKACDLPQIIELGAPEFCTFDNMLAFHRQFLLHQ